VIEHWAVVVPGMLLAVFFIAMHAIYTQPEKPRPPAERARPSARELDALCVQLNSEMGEMRRRFGHDVAFDRWRMAGSRQRPSREQLRYFTLAQMEDRARWADLMFKRGEGWRVWRLDKNRAGALYHFPTIGWPTRRELQPACLLVVKCPSKRTTHLLLVPPTMRSVRQARAWTFGMDEGEFAPASET
jgi:hypothetical protein